MSPILANIYLSELDIFIENYRVDFNKGDTNRKVSKAYRKTKYAYDKRKAGLKDAENRSEALREFKGAQKKMLQTRRHSVTEPEYKRLQYNRYADDFTVSRSLDTKRRKDGVLPRAWYGKVRFYAPYDKWVGKLREYRAFKIVKDETGKEKW
jgi:hypothetical protein